MIAALCKFQKGQICDGRNWPIPAGCELHPLHQSAPCSPWGLLRCQIKMYNVERVLVGRNVARYASEISRVRGLPALSQTLTSTGLPALSLIAGITRGWQIWTKGLSFAVGLPDVCHSQCNMSSDMSHTSCAPARFVQASYQTNIWHGRIRGSRVLILFQDQQKKVCRVLLFNQAERDTFV